MYGLLPTKYMCADFFYKNNLLLNKSPLHLYTTWHNSFTLNDTIEILFSKITLHLCTNK